MKMMRTMMKQKNKFSVISNFLLVIFTLSLISCEGDDLRTVFSGEPPVITEVSLVETNEPVSSGFRRSFYVIKGENLESTREVLFNGAPAFVNPSFVTKSNIVVAIPENAPYGISDSILEVVTSFGTATIPFSINQPRPEISSIVPLAAGAGEEVTITGDIFEGLLSVRFGDVEAEIVSFSSTEIIVLVPENIVQAKIFVETPGGLTESDVAFGFKFVVYDDFLATGWWIGGWGGSQIFDSTTVVRRGDFSIERTTEGFSGFQIGNGGAPLPLADFSAIKVSLYYDGVGTNDVRIVVNEKWDDGNIVTLQGGEWMDFTFTFEELGVTEGTIDQFVVQEFSGSSVVIYIDDIGMI